MTSVIFLWLLAVISIALSDGAKILIIFPLAAKSHHIFTRAIAEELASKGHEIKFYTPLLSEKNITNIQEIKLSGKLDSFRQEFNFRRIQEIGRMQVFGLPGFFFMGLHISDASLRDPVLTNLIQSDEKFDIILLETFFGQESFLAFGHKFKAPIVSINPFSSHLGSDEVFGNPFGIAYRPTSEVHYTDKMTFIQRVHNTLRSLIYIFGYYAFYIPKQESIMRNHFKFAGSANIPPITDLLQNISLLIVNSQFSVDFARPLVPNIVNAGGAHISPNRKPLPKDLKEFMDNSKNGVIYFSLGSVVPIEQFPESIVQSFMKAFGKLKQNVLWKSPFDSLPGLPRNVKLGKWLPQHDILAHTNCLAFITHGGLLSQEEAVYFGVPLIGIPFFGDQFTNINRAVDRGFAVTLDQYNITEESVLWAVNQILTDPSYRQNVQKYSKIFRDNPLPPKEAAAYWIEYVMRHNGAPHLRSEGSKIPYYKYLLLDVIGFMILSLALVAFVLYNVVKFIFKKVFYRHCTLKAKSVVKKKKKQQ